MACISPSPAAALGTSRAQFLLLHSTVVALLQHIFSSLRYCSCFITVKIEPRNVIIYLYVRYHYEQENKWFSASASIGLTKIVAWVNFFTSILSEVTRSFSSPKKEIIILVGKKSTSVCTWNLRGKTEKKKRNYTKGKSFFSFLLNVSETNRSHFHVIYSYNNFTGTGFWGGKTICEEQGKDACLC